MKLVFAARGLPQVDYEVLLRRTGATSARCYYVATPRIPALREAGQPRSSVGISKASARRN